MVLVDLNASEFPFFVIYNSVFSVGDFANLNSCSVFGYYNGESGLVGNPDKLWYVGLRASSRNIDRCCCGCIHRDA
jgi:hypothetical protein